MALNLTDEHEKKIFLQLEKDDVAKVTFDNVKQRLDGFFTVGFLFCILLGILDMTHDSAFLSILPVIAVIVWIFMMLYIITFAANEVNMVSRVKSAYLDGIQDADSQDVQSD